MVHTLTKVHHHLHAVRGGEPDEEEHPPHRVERAVHHGLRGAPGGRRVFTGQIDDMKTMVIA